MVPEALPWIAGTGQPTTTLIINRVGVLGSEAASGWLDTDGLAASPRLGRRGGYAGGAAEDDDDFEDDDFDDFEDDDFDDDFEDDDFEDDDFDDFEDDELEDDDFDDDEEF
jgi:hypothetical protein